MQYEFAGFQFDPDRGLLRAGEEIPLAPKPLRLLEALLAERGGVLTKDRIAEKVWGRRDVSDDSIFRAVYNLRKSFERFGVDPIGTAHGNGFRLAAAVAVAQGSPTSALEPFTRSVNPAAVESLMVAVKFRARRSPEDFATAVEAARRATELDPNYVAAWTNLAELHALEGIRWYHPPRASFEAAREAAGRALAVDRGSPGAVAIDGFVAGVLDLDFAGGIARLDEAIATDPSYVIGRTLRGFLHSATGRFDLAEVDLRLALELNPLSAHTHHNLCAMLLFDGRVESALEEARSFAARCPTIDNTLNQWAQFAAILGSVDEALAAGRMARQLSPATTQMHVGLLMALVAAGRTGEASELLDEMLRAPVPAPPPHLAPALLELGDRAGAVALLERAREARCLHFLVAEFDPRLRDLAGDPDLAPLWSEVRAARAVARGGQRAPSVAARGTGVAKRAASGARR